MRGLVALDWQRVRARPARLLMPVLTFLTPVLLLPLLSLTAEIDAQGRIAFLWLLATVSLTAALNEVLDADWRSYWIEAWVAAGGPLWLYLLAKLAVTLVARLLPLALALWLGAALWGVRPSPSMALALALLAPGFSAMLLLIAVLSLGSRRVQPLAPLLLLPLAAAPLLIGISASLTPTLGLFLLAAAWSATQLLCLLPLSAQLLKLWLAAR